MSNAALAADRSEARTASDRPEPMNTRHGKKQDRKFGTIIAPYLFVLPAFVIVFVFIVLAALNTFRLAFTDSTLLRPGKFVGFENFIKLFHDEYFLTALLNSTIYVICVVPFMVILPLILAYLVKGNSRIMGFFRTAFYMPVVMSAVVVGMIWTNLLDSAGLVNSVLKALKIISKPIPFLTDRWGVLFSSMFVTIWLGLGYYMVMYMASMSAVPISLYESANLDGAGRLTQFFQITIPLIWTNIRTTLTFFIISTINMAFLFVKAMTSGGPNGASDVALSYMYSQKDAGLYGYSMAIGVVIFLFSFALSACVNKVTNRDTLEF